jgi:hypothetical protein
MVKRNRERVAVAISPHVANANRRLILKYLADKTTLVDANTRALLADRLRKRPKEPQ